MMFENLLSNPKYYSALIRSTGLLSGKEREERIRKLLDINIWLAAKCKNTCILEEEDITDAIILKCASLYENKKDPLSIVALLELGEVGVICFLAHIGAKIGFTLYDDPDQSVAHLFSVIGENLPVDVFWEVYHQIEELGYSLDLDLYNLALSRLPKKGDAQSIFQAMESSGIKADARTFYYLISRSTSYQDALAFYNRFKEEKCDIDSLINSTVRAMISLAPSWECVDALFQDARRGGAEKPLDRSVRRAFFARKVAVAESSSDCVEALKAAGEFMSTLTSGKKLFYTELITSFCTFLNRLRDTDSELFDSISLFLGISKQVSPTGYFRKNKVSNDMKRMLSESFQRVVFRSHSTQIAIELFQLLDSHNIEIDPYLLGAAIKVVDTSDNLRRLLDMSGVVNPSPRWVIECIKPLSNEMAAGLYVYLSANNYSFSIDVFKAFVKKAPFDKALYYINEMSNKHVLVNIPIIQSLIHKFSDKDDFMRILSIAYENHLQPDSNMFSSIMQKARIDPHAKEMILSVNNQDVEKYGLPNLWIRFLAEVQVELGRVL